METAKPGLVPGIIIDPPTLTPSEIDANKLLWQMWLIRCYGQIESTRLSGADSSGLQKIYGGTPECQYRYNSIRGNPR